MATTSRDDRNHWRWFLTTTVVGWLVLFGFLLLTSDPPLRAWEDQGHLFGSLLLGFLMAVMLTAWTTRGRAFALAMATTVTVVAAFEVLQELRPGRGYQRIDAQLNLIGAVIGVVLGSLAAVAFDQIRKRGIQSGDIGEDDTR